MYPDLNTCTVVLPLAGDPQNKADLIPVDLCVNQMLVHGMQRALHSGSEVRVVHSGSSHLNAMCWGEPIQIVQDYWQSNPPKGAIAKCHFRMIQDPRVFDANWNLRYRMPP